MFSTETSSLPGLLRSCEGSSAAPGRGEVGLMMGRDSGAARSGHRQAAWELEGYLESVGLQWGSPWIHNGALGLEKKGGWARSQGEAEAGTKADPRSSQVCPQTSPSRRTQRGSSFLPTSDSPRPWHPVGGQ